MSWETLQLVSGLLVAGVTVAEANLAGEMIREWRATRSERPERYCRERRAQAQDRSVVEARRT